MRLSVEPWACALNQRFSVSWVAENCTISFLTEKRSLMLYICVSDEPNLAGFVLYLCKSCQNYLDGRDHDEDGVKNFCHSCWSYLQMLMFVRSHNVRMFSSRIT